MCIHIEIMKPDMFLVGYDLALRNNPCRFVFIVSTTQVEMVDQFRWDLACFSLQNMRSGYLYEASWFLI